MPRYDAACPEHGQHEVFSVPSIARTGFVPCGTCGCSAPLVFSAAALPRVLSDSTGEDLTRAQAPGRVADGTHVYNMGLAGVETALGRDASGKERKSYRPISNAEVGSAGNAAEIAKRQGLTVIEGARHRSLA